MKKFFSIALVAAAMLFAGKANAQISIHGGYQSYTLKASSGSYSTSASDDGFYVGASYNSELGTGLGVAPGIYVAYVENIVDLRVPILVNFGLKFGEIGVGVFAGPNVNIGLFGDAYTADYGGKKRFDIGLTFGGKLSYQKISLDCGYNMGLLNQRKDAPDDVSVKANQFFVGLGYSL